MTVAHDVSTGCIAGRWSSIGHGGAVSESVAGGEMGESCIMETVHVGIG